MPTVAEHYANKMTNALATQPAPFVIDGKNVALVTVNGLMAVVDGAVLTVNQAKDLRTWIKSTFLDGGNAL